MPTSAIRYPVFVRGKNYTGSNPGILNHRLFADYLVGVLGPELEVVDRALVIPLGKAAESAVRLLSERGVLEEERCLFGMPHPSGANAHRQRTFETNAATLRSKASAWFG